MDAKQFKKRLKEIYNQSKRGEHDSSFDDVCNEFMLGVRGKSGGGWDESVALQTIAFAEHVYQVQPETARVAQAISSDDAEAELESFLADRGFNYTHIPESKNQSPDGRIYGFGFEYLCELKSPILMFDHNEAPFGYKHTTTHRKILQAIHDAKRQLEALDPSHDLPHILIYTSAHFQLNYSNFTDAIRGYMATTDGKITTDFRNTEIFKKTEKTFDDLDLYAWLQINDDKRFYQVSYFNNQNSAHSGAIDELTGQLKATALSSMDNHESIQCIRGL